MANKENVSDHYPGFSQPSKRMHFNNPISSDVSTNAERYELVENFARKPGINGDIQNSAESTRMIANPDFEVLGTGGTTDDVTFSTTTGGLLLTTDSSASQQVIIAPHLDTGQTAWTNIGWGTENQVIWEAVIRTGASVASIVIWAGLKLTNTEAIATDADQAYFRFDAGVANWETVTTVGNVADTEVNTGVVVAINTNYYFRIEIDSDRKPHYFINDKEVNVGAALTNDVNLIPYIGVEGNAKTLYVIKEKISRIIFE